MIPFIMGNSEGKKSSLKVVKYLAIFGILGAVIIAFIFLAKKFNPLKSIKNFLSKGVKNIGGFFGGIGGVLPGILSGGIIPGIVGLGKVVSKLKPRKKVEMGKVETRRQLTDQYYAKENEAVRREFRRYAKTVTRKLENLKKVAGIPREMAGRISMVKSAFKSVDRTFVRDIPKQFDVIFNRKAKFLEGNLIGSFRRAEIVGVSRVLAEANKGYGAKIALMELQAKRGGMY